jgi:cell division protein FtsL
MLAQKLPLRAAELPQPDFACSASRVGRVLRKLLPTPGAQRGDARRRETGRPRPPEMVRLNIFLLLAVVICSLGVVTSQHKARKIFQALEAEQERARQLEVEFGQLQLELSTWGTAPRIEKIAREKLKMRAPETGRVITAIPAGGLPQ